MGATIIRRNNSPYLWAAWDWAYLSPADLNVPDMARRERALTMLNVKADEWLELLGVEANWVGHGFQVWHSQRARHYTLQPMQTPHCTDVETVDIPRPKETRTHYSDWRSDCSRWVKHRKSPSEIDDWDCSHDALRRGEEGK